MNAKAERLLNVNAKSLVFETYYITDAFDYNLNSWHKIPIFGRLVPFFVILWICLFVDRLHFYCDHGILPSKERLTFDFRELNIYRFFNIPVFLYTYGADVRTRNKTESLGKPNCCVDCEMIESACICNDEKADRYFMKLSKMTKTIFCMGDMCEYIPRSEKDLYYWPVNIEQETEKYRTVYPDPSNDRSLRIVHAPNHRLFKGTQYLTDAVETLKNEGLNIELILVEKIPNTMALDLYRTADIVFDQCLIGFHGYFALEAMAIGKPVMCYIRKPSEYLLDHSRCPIINTSISTLKDDIQNLYSDRQSLHRIGRESRKYIEKYFSLTAFAGRLNRVYQDMGITI